MKIIDTKGKDVIVKDGMCRDTDVGKVKDIDLVFFDDTWG